MLVFVGIFRVWDGLGSMGSVCRAIVHNVKQHFIDEMNAKVGTESLQVVVTGRDSRQSMSPSFYLIPPALQGHFDHNMFQEHLWQARSYPLP